MPLELYDTLTRAKQPVPPPAEQGQIKLYTWLVSALRVREFSWLQRQDGIIDEAQWGSELAVTLAILQAPRVRKWWDTVGNKTVSSDFREFIEAQIREVPPSNGIYEEQMKWADE